MPEAQALIVWLLLGLVVRFALVMLYRRWHARHPARWLVERLEPDYATNQAEQLVFHAENGRWL